MSTNATLLLCDNAQVYDNKLTTVGSGWLITNPGPAVFGVGVSVELDTDDVDHPHTAQIMLRDADGRPVTDPNGNPVRIDINTVAVQVPADHPAGLPIVWNAAFNFAGLPLAPSARYQLVLTIDNAQMWVREFATRATPLAMPMAS